MNKMIYLLIFFLLLLEDNILGDDLECVDRMENCRQTFCKNGDYIDMMMYWCAKTCNLCHIRTPTPPSKHPDIPLPPHVGGCGKPDVQNARVVGGKVAVRGSWPWQVVVIYYGYAKCGGSLIAPQWVITAAHCVSGRDSHPDYFTIRLGDLNRDIDEGSEQDFSVVSIVKHPHWNSWTLNYDVALLKLDRPVLFNKFISPICLPTIDPPTGTQCYITGWGKLEYPGRMTDILQQGRIPIVSNRRCQQLNKKEFPMPIRESMICAGDAGKTNIAGCHGDSGGPLACMTNGTWFLHGVVSHGSRFCKSARSYTVFARVTSFHQWIDRIIK